MINYSPLEIVSEDGSFDTNHYNVVIFCQNISKIYLAPPPQHIRSRKEPHNSSECNFVRAHNTTISLLDVTAVIRKDSIQKAYMALEILRFLMRYLRMTLRRLCLY